MKKTNYELSLVLEKDKNIIINYANRTHSF